MKINFKKVIILLSTLTTCLFFYSCPPVDKPEAKSNNALLSALDISDGILAPTFEKNIMSYTVNLQNSISQVRFTATTEESHASIKINSQNALSGIQTEPISISIGANEINIEITAQDGTTKKTYTLTVTRASGSANNNLSALTISSGALNPSFSSSTVLYSAIVTVSSITVTPTVSESHATVTVNSQAVVSGNASQGITLSDQLNIISIAVTAQSSATKTYTVNVYKAAELTIDTWKNDAITAGILKWYYFNGSAGKEYRIRWDDYKQGSGTKTCDISVSAYRQDGSTTYFSSIDSSYNSPLSITVSSDEVVYIKVQGYNTTSSGTFGIKYKEPIVSGTYTGPGEEYYPLAPEEGTSFAYNLDLGANTRDVYFIFTNTNTSYTSVYPAVSSNIISKSSSISSVPKNTSIQTEQKNEAVHGKKEIDEFNANPFKYIGQNSGTNKSIIVPPPQKDTISQTNSFYYNSTSNLIPATCRKIVTNGTKTLNIWVANDSWVAGGTRTKLVTQAMIDILAGKFLLSGGNNDIYDWITNIYGDEWGAHGYLDLISPNNEITILLYDIDNDNSTTGGVLGFFWTKDNFKTSSCAYSNQRLMFYIDSVMLADEEGASWEITDYWPSEMISTLAHEFQHMIHFYQKVIKNSLSINSEIWLNEMCSLVAEDFVADKLGVNGPRGVLYSDPGPGNINNVYGRLPLYNYFDEQSVNTWLSGDYTIVSYSIAYAFGSYLARNYGGVSLLKNIAQNNKTDYTSINSALTSGGYSNETFITALRKWGIAVLLSDRTGTVSGYKYNNGSSWFTSSNNGITYNLGSINLFNYKADTLIGPYIYSSIPAYDMNKSSNTYYIAGDNITGNKTWNFSNIGTDTQITVVVK